MNHPRTVRLLTQRVPIISAAHIMHDDKPAWGLFDPDRTRIIIARGQGHDRERVTFLHENLHAIVDVTALSVDFGIEKEEAIVDRMSPVLLAWMRENPRAVRYLMERA